MPPNPPDYGVGPTNITNPGEISPFAAFDNTIRYQDMARYQMISQYQQNVIRPATMTLAQQRQVATQARFQYGVPGGQENTARFYQRQQEGRRGAFGGAVTSGIFDFGLYEAASIAATGAGATGLMGAMVLPTIAALPISMGIGWGLQNTIKRQKFMHSMSSDVENYRDKLGFTGDLSYGRASMLGASLEGMMEDKKGGFFSKDQMARIHKIGLSNDMLSARSRGTGSGSLKQYEKNVKDLIETTEGVVKLLNTTIEGGMSVIKELNQVGFKDLNQIKQQIVQSKAIGAMTGLGAQNVMQIGAAGARAAQGTPYSAHTGAAMYQLGAASAQAIGQTSTGAYAVDRVGGVAGAAGVIGNFQMNVLSSGMGTRAIAYMIDPKTGMLDRKKADRFLGGGVSAYEIMRGSDAVGHALGESGRYMFEMNKANVINNQISAKERALVTTNLFEAWGNDKKYVSQDAKRLAFARMFTSSPDEAAVVYQSLSAGVNYGILNANAAVEMGVANQYTSKRTWGPTARAAQETWKGGKDVFNYIGKGIYGAGMGISGVSATLAKGTGETFAKITDIIGVGVGIYDKYGGREGGDFGDIRKNLRVIHGLEATGSLGAIGRMRLSEGRAIDDKNLRYEKSKINIDFDKLIKSSSKDKASMDDLNKLIQNAQQAIVTGKMDAFVNNSFNMRMLGASGKYSADGASEWRTAKTQDMIHLVNGLAEKKSSARSKLDSIEQQMITERNKLTNKSDINAYDAEMAKQYRSWNEGTWVSNPKSTQNRYISAQMALLDNMNVSKMSDINVASARNDLRASINAAYGPKNTLLSPFASAPTMYGGTFKGRNLTPLKKYAKYVGIDIYKGGKDGGINDEKMEELGARLIDLNTRAGQGRLTDEKEQKLYAEMGAEYVKGLAEKAGKVGDRAEAQRRENLIPGILREAGGYKIGKTSEKGFERGLRKIFLNDMSKDAATEFINKYKENLSSSFGIGPSELKDLFKSGNVTTLADKLSGFATEKQRITDPAAQMAKINQDLKRLTTKGNKDLKEVYQEGGLTKDIKPGDVPRQIEMLKTEYENISLTKKLQEAGIGGSLNAGVRSPVLNYWNNRWVL